MAEACRQLAWVSTVPDAEVGALAGHQLAAVLQGRAEPAGHLPVTIKGLFPYGAGQ